MKSRESFSLLSGIEPISINYRKILLNLDRNLKIANSPPPTVQLTFDGKGIPFGYLEQDSLIDDLGFLLQHHAAPRTHFPSHHR